MGWFPAPPPRRPRAVVLTGAGGTLFLFLSVALAWFPRSAEAQADSTAVEFAAAEAESAGSESAEGAASSEGLGEQVQALQGVVDVLRKFKFSGYVQARWESAENQSDSVRVSGSPATLTSTNRQRFFIRRARLKLTYDASSRSQAVVYFDGGADRANRLLEAYVTLIDPWTVARRHQLTIGQMNVPFGYELERSSSLRELPERSRAENVLFPGERDRGIKIVSKWTDRLETVAGVWNGGGINHPDFPTTDPTRDKDFTARARWTSGKLDGAVSYYTGNEVIALTGPDVEADKTRLGLDAQAYYELPRFGGGSLRGELYSGENVNADSVSALVQAPTSANPVRLLRPGADPAHLSTDFLGGYAMWVQNLGDHFQLAFRFDAYDPDLDVDHDDFERYGIALNAFYDGFTRVTVSYEIPKTEVSAGGGRFTDPKDNLWTVQFQHRF